MKKVFFSGHGYENPSPGSGYKPCTVFQGYDVLANPLGGFSEADRARRSFPAGWGNVRVTYDSHAVKLGRTQPSRFDAGDRSSGTLAVMMQHGGGRRVSLLRICQMREEIEAALLAMPEAALYFLLYAIAETVEDANRQGYAQAADEWRTAVEEKRIRRRRGRAEIEDPYFANARREKREARAAARSV
jgi:hypothetical protein